MFVFLFSQIQAFVVIEVNIIFNQSIFLTIKKLLGSDTIRLEITKIKVTFFFTCFPLFYLPIRHLVHFCSILGSRFSFGSLLCLLGLVLPKLPYGQQCLILPSASQHISLFSYCVRHCFQWCRVRCSW